MKKKSHAANDFINPLTELGEALAAKWNGMEGHQKYNYDPETETIISETGTGLDFKRHLKEVLGIIPASGIKRTWWQRIRHMIRNRAHEIWTIAGQDIPQHR